MGKVSSEVFLFLILLSMPLILVFSLFMSISNISLIRHEGFRPANALGIIISVFLALGVAAVSYTHLDVYKRQDVLVTVTFDVIAKGDATIETNIAQICLLYTSAHDDARVFFVYDLFVVRVAQKCKCNPVRAQGRFNHIRYITRSLIHIYRTALERRPADCSAVRYPGCLLCCSDKGVCADFWLRVPFV